MISLFPDILSINHASEHERHPTGQSDEGQKKFREILHGGEMVGSNGLGIQAINVAHIEFITIAKRLWGQLQIRDDVISRKVYMPMVGTSWVHHRSCTIFFQARGNEAMRPTVISA